MLPVVSSFAAVISSGEVEDIRFYYYMMPLNCSEEETKNTSNLFEEEKSFSSITYILSPLVPSLKVGSCFFVHSKPLTGISLLPYNPPDVA